MKYNMRELNEYKSEIFLRSEERIRTRKRRLRTITALCMPFVVCIAAFSIFILPALMPADKAAPEMSDDMCNDLNGIFHHYTSGDGSSYCDDAVVTLLKNGVVIQKTDREYISELRAELKSLVPYDVGDAIGDPSEPTDNGGVNESASDTEKETQNQGMSNDIYQIIIVDGNVKQEYKLVGNELTDVTNNNSVALSKDELVVLKDLLEKED